MSNISKRIDFTVENQSLSMKILHTIPIILICATMGPYVLGTQLRTEYLGVLFAVAFSGVGIMSGKFKVIELDKDFVDIAFLWASYIIVICIGDLFPISLNDWNPGSQMAGIVNAAMPLLVFISVGLIVFLIGHEKTLKLIAYSIILVMLFNTFISAYSSRGISFQHLPMFWSANSPGDLAVGYYASGNGRYSGLFNQPAEAGVAYGLALILCVFVLRRNVIHLILVSLCLLVGGILTVSKIFIGPAMLMFAICFIFVGPRRVKRIKSGLVVFAVLAPVIFLFLETGKSFNYLSRLFNPSGSLVSFYSAGRYGSEGSLADAFDAVHKTSPIFGVGASGLMTPYDSQFLETFLVSGLLGLIIIATVFLKLVIKTGKIAASGDVDGFVVSFSIIVFALFSMLGLPALTGNRESTFLWATLALISTWPISKKSDENIEENASGASL